jgi:hypothetical protein
MEHLKDLYELCEFLNADVKKINAQIRAAGGEINRDTLNYLDKLTHSLKSVKTTIAMIEEAENGYSERGTSYARGDRTGRVHWNDGTMSYADNSYARGRTGNVRRDSMGRYSRDDMRYSNGGYSMDNDDLIDELNDLMRDADDKMKPEFQRFIKKLEQM